MSWWTVVGLALYCSVAVSGKEIKTPSAVKTLTEENFDEVNSGVWLLEVYAPFCSHCKALEPTWEAVAVKLQGQVNVAKIDGTIEKSIVQQLRVEGFPTIYLMRDGKTHEYPSTGNRGASQLVNFALEGYKKVDPMPFYRAPNSLVGHYFGKARRLPRMVSKQYHYLNKELGYSELGLLCGALLVPVVLGLLFICIVDAVVVRGRQQGHAHQH